MFTNKTGKAQQQIRTFWKVFVKLLATFTSKSRKHNFRKACLCLLPLVAFHSQRRLFPSLFPPANSNLKQKGRTGTENGTKAAGWRNPRWTWSCRFWYKWTYSTSLHFYCQRELAKSKATKHSFNKMIFQARARNVTVTAVPSFLPHEP